MLRPSAPLAALALLGLLLLPRPALAAPDVFELALDAMMSADSGELERLLAPNFVFIGPNGHVQDKEHFLEAIGTRALNVKAAKFRNLRETSSGSVRLLTGNGVFDAGSADPQPPGLMQVSVVKELGDKQERLVLVQLTPVLPSPSCPDGNCRLR